MAYLDDEEAENARVEDLDVARMLLLACTRWDGDARRACLLVDSSLARAAAAGTDWLSLRADELSMVAVWQACR